MPDRPEVTAVEIARLAGVGRAAVSNWRRRHPDFPRPVGGTDSSPTFPLDQVEQWLRDQGKIAELPPLERAWQQLETLRDPDGPPVAPLIGAGAFLLLLHRDPAAWTALADRPDTRLATDLPRALRHAARAAIGPDATDRLGLPPLVGPTYLDLARLLARLADAHGAPAAYEQLLTRHAEANTRQLAPTPPEAAALLAALPQTGTAPHAAETTGAAAARPHRAADAGGAPLDEPGVAPWHTGAVSRPDSGAADGPSGAAAPAWPHAAAAAGGPAVPPGPSAAGAVTVLDPACGLGALLLAAGPGAVRAGQDLDAGYAALAVLRLALQTPGAWPGPLAVDLRPGDALRADAHPGLLADAVLCQPPYNERDWGHDELQFDPRWSGGVVPPRGESELAWLLHCLSHTRPGGLAALLLPPTVASRRAGRRVRSELIRTGALRAVVALPAGTAPPYGVPLHLWVLRRPRPGDDFRQVLLLDAAAAHPAAEGGRDRIDWPALTRTVLDTWYAFDAAARSGGPLPADRPGVHRTVTALDLLDDETDLSPARHLPAAPTAPPDTLSHLRTRVGELLGTLADLDARLPEVTAVAEPVVPPSVTVGELARAGALEVHSSGQGPAAGTGATPLLTDQDLLAGRPPSGTTDATDAPTARPGDVLLPALGGETAHAVRAGDPYDGAVLGPRLHLLRPDPEQVDPDYLAGRLRATGAARRASSYASTTTRLDIRRLELPRLPVERQRVLGAAFRRLADFRTDLARTTELADTLTRTLTDALAAGTVEPADGGGESDG
ncbi:N-6 DNA methylase [Kitasatospora terrestris]|uniref:DNA methylase adenine-specific domain-containing protein n=1 Tax=Kitasatospora terrestris TaxID=258051 RepID=A0ABP9DXX9_9ACTN